MNVKNLVLGVGIVIVFALVLWQGFEAFYPTPLYEIFCNQTVFMGKTSPVIAQQNCFVSQKIRNNGGLPVYGYDVTGCATEFKECNFCNKEYEAAALSHSKIVFVISLIVAILAVITGYFVLSIEPVGSALMGSGIWAIFYGTVVNWRNFTTVWRFLLLFLVFIVLVWITLRLNKERKGEKRR